MPINNKKQLTGCCACMRERARAFDFGIYDRNRLVRRAKCWRFLFGVSSGGSSMIHRCRTRTDVRGDRGTLASPRNSCCETTKILWNVLRWTCTSSGAPPDSKPFNTKRLQAADQRRKQSAEIIARNLYSEAATSSKHDPRLLLQCTCKAANICK